MARHGSQRRDEQMENKKRLVIAIEGTPMAVRVVPHKTDDTQLVLKAGNGESAQMLCALMGVPVLSHFQGQNYFVTCVSRLVFTGALPGLVYMLGADAPAPQVKMAPLLALPLPQAKAKCVECGVTDGAHWGFCPMNGGH